MQANLGDTVEIEYTGKFESGTIFDTNKGKSPLKFILGANNLILGFNKNIIGMKLNEEKEFKLTPDEAYGKVKLELRKTLPIEAFVKETGKQPKLKTAVTLPATINNNKQNITGIITDIHEKTFNLDFNHPLAGKTLNFKVKLLNIIKK